MYSSLDNGMISQLLRLQVLSRLKEKFGEQMYNESNVMLSGEYFVANQDRMIRFENNN